MSPTGGVRGFVARPIGRVALIALSIAVLTLSFLFVGLLFAIPAFLIFGLGVPIYLGWKRPKHLAIAGLVTLLVTAPVVSSVWTFDIQQPSPAGYSTEQVGASGQHGSLLQNAEVHPFSGAPGRTYVFSVAVHPEYLRAGENLTYVYLYVSTCQYVTVNSSPSCPSSGPFPHYALNHSFAQPPTSAITITYNQSLPGTNIWWWNVYAAVRNSTTGNYTWIPLSPAGGYPAIEGPVTGDFLGVLGLVIVPIYLTVFIYPGLVFYIALLLYVLLKNREARRKGFRDPAMAPPPLTSGPSGSDVVGTPPAADERTCPNCRAIIYPHETRCWKCGTDLSAPEAGGAALPSSKPP